MRADEISIGPAPAAGMRARALATFGAAALAVVAALAPRTASAEADPWPRFRGPDATGVAEDDPRLPMTWSATENVVWKTPVEGMGWSSPVVWGRNLFLTSVISTGEVEAPKKGLYFGGERETSKDTHRWEVTCFDTETGEVRWKKTAMEGIPPAGRHLKNTYASETPCTDGQRVYALFGNVGIWCFDFEGRELWSHRLQPYETFQNWGTGASPIVHKGRIYVVQDNHTRSYMLCIDAATGDVVWEVDRPGETSNWVTPFIWENELRTELITCGLQANRSYDLDGNLLWELRGMSMPTVPSPFAHDGLLYISSGWVMDKFKPVYAIRPGASGDITLAEGETSNEHIVWFTSTVGAYHPSGLLYKGLYYTLQDRGFFLCNDAKTGEVVYDKHRIEKGSPQFTTSPWAYNDRIFCQNEDGDTYVIKPGREFEVVGKNSLEEFSMASPAISDGSLYIRTAGNLYRLQNRERTVAK